MEKKVDLRILKTRKSVYDALFKLMEEKEFEQIRVSEICEKALINRSTFYSHFEDKYELLTSMFEDIKSVFLADMKPVEEYETLKDYYIAVFTNLINRVDGHYGAGQSQLIVNNRNSIAVDVIYQNLMKCVQERISLSGRTNIPAEFETHFYVGAIFNVAILWLRNKDKYTKDEIIEYVTRLIP